MDHFKFSDIFKVIFVADDVFCVFEYAQELQDEYKLSKKEAIAEAWVTYISLAKLDTAAREKIPSEKFAVPGKRKLPIHDCAHVRNAMARFNQTQGLTSAEKAAARRRILAAAKKCGIEVKNF